MGKRGRFQYTESFHVKRNKSTRLRDNKSNDRQAEIKKICLAWLEICSGASSFMAGMLMFTTNKIHIMAYAIVILLFNFISTLARRTFINGIKG